jgi:hypothetical protein
MRSFYKNENNSLSVADHRRHQNSWRFRSKPWRRTPKTKKRSLMWTKKRPQRSIRHAKVRRR